MCMTLYAAGESRDPSQHSHQWYPLSLSVLVCFSFSFQTLLGFMARSLCIQLTFSQATSLSSLFLPLSTAWNDVSSPGRTTVAELSLLQTASNSPRAASLQDSSQDIQ
uniref:Uncharacterized protein n=1 Tax=Sphaerodactylus townsendi TaxID=933632 RepID=A0ACB8ESW1_9SAUR